MEYYPKVPPANKYNTTPRSQCEPLSLWYRQRPLQNSKSPSVYTNGCFRNYHLLHIKHRDDFLTKNQNTTNKLMAHLDKKYFYKDNCQQTSKDSKGLSHKIKKISLSLSINNNKNYRFCKNQCLFTYSNCFYQTNFRLGMGSPINSVLVCLLLEFLESGPFQNIVGPQILNNSGIQMIPYWYIQNILNY